MADIRSFAKALKISWIQKKYGTNDVWLLNKRSLSLLACPFVENTFWTNVFESWAEYVHRKLYTPATFCHSHYGILFLLRVCP